MSDVDLITLGLIALWLGGLTFVLLLVIRQVELITLRLDIPGQITQLPANGPDAGTVLSAEVIERHPEFEQGLVYILLASPTCVPCREVVPDLSSVDVPGRVFALLPGSRQLVDDFIPLVPSTYDVIRDPLATETANLLSMERTPSVLEVEDGVVTGKAYLFEASDLARLIDARAESDARSFVTFAKEAGDNAVR